MPPDTDLSEVVVFEIPGFDRAMRLYELPGKQWLAWVESGDGIKRVSVLIQPDEADLATLLRVAERGSPRPVSARSGSRWVNVSEV